MDQALRLEVRAEEIAGQHSVAPRRRAGRVACMTGDSRSSGARRPLSRARQHPQDLRPLRGAEVDLALRRPRRADRLPRAFGLRQDHAAAHHRRARDRRTPARSSRTVATSRGCRRSSATTASSSSPTRSSRTSRSTTTSPTVSSIVGRAAKRSGRASTSCWRWSGCRPKARNIPGQLSGGQQQRIALARALAPAPGLLLLDEPLSALDALERVRLRGEIRSLQQRLGVTTVMVTHDQEEALSMADRIVVMNHGVHRPGRHAARNLRDAR